MTVATTDARELVTDLVAIPSPSGEEAAAAERLAAFFETAGREVFVDDVGNVRAPGDDGVLLTSHVDTVPGEIPVRTERVAPEARRDEGGEVAEQSSAVHRTRSDETAEVLWGRGSVDATGPLAAMAAAAVETGASFAGVVGEEADSRGARHLITDRAVPDAVVNGEPSGADGITLGYRGFVAGTARFETEGRHSSRPEANAVQAAIRSWAAVEETFASEGPVFESVTAKPVAFDGGPTEDGHAVAATVAFQLRVPPGETVAEVKATAEAALSDAADVAWIDAIPPVMESARTEVARAFRAAIRAEGATPRLLRKTGTSDVNLYADAWDRPMATYGPGDSALDHAPDERLDLGEFDRSVAVLTRVARALTEGGA